MKKLLLFSCLFSLFAACGTNSDKQDARKTLEPSSLPTNEEKSTKKIILFFGNSLAAGYGLDEPSQAFPALVQRRIDSMGLPYAVVNAGLSGETSAGGDGRIEWVLRQPVDVFVLELGANDGLRGIPVEETRKNLQSIIDKVRLRYPNVKLVMAGMQAPPNMGKDFTDRFKEIYPDLAMKNAMVLVPFLLEGVAGESELNQSDGIHPTAEGHRILMENVWKVMRILLKS